MRQTMLAGVLAFALVGCARQPHAELGGLSTADPKFNSPGCLDIRSRAVTYDDKVGERAAIGLAGGLLLGVFFLPVAVAIDSNQNQQRAAFNREIELRCMTNPPKREVQEPPPYSGGT